jgi:hypothetical protein
MISSPRSHLVLLFLFCELLGNPICAQNSQDPTNPSPDKLRNIQATNRFFQFSLFPGISTNGYNSASFHNQFSINLFGGSSAGNGIFEIGGITNMNGQGVTGIQFAGLANIVGANAFTNLSTPEQRMLTNNGFRSNQKGIQAAGILNYVRNNSAGIQIAGGFNVTGDNSKGIQIAGLGNTAGGDSEGLQLAGLYNISTSSMSGIQLSAIVNITEGQLTGTQIALMNKAGRTKGGKSTPPTSARGFQLGLVNFCGDMDGWQVGLINFSKTFKGKQIGLINFFPRYGAKEIMRRGTPIGLLNFNSNGSYLRIQADEIFPYNLERSSGNCLNCTFLQSGMPIDDQNLIYNQNVLIGGFDPVLKTWGFGYGFQKVLYNKNSILITDVKNKRRMIAYGIKFMHLNYDGKFDSDFNLLNRLNFDWGRRKFGGYIFAGVSLNYFLFAGEQTIDVYKIRSAVVAAGKPFDLNAYFWPGYSIGYQF